MNSNYISTQSLYDSGAHLAHARQYSHKYIKREPDGKGGYKYYYKTDLNVRPINSSSTITATSYSDGGRRPVSKFRQADKASQIYREGQYKNTVDYESRKESDRKKRQDSRIQKKALSLTSPEPRPGSPEWYTAKQNIMNWRLDQQNRNGTKVSTEYQKELEANSKKNVYPETRINETIIPEKRIYENVITETDQLKTPKNSSKSIGDYAKQAVNTISTAAGSAYDKGKNFLKNLFK